MGFFSKLFGRESSESSSDKKKIARLEKTLAKKNKRIKDLERRSDNKDDFFKAMISDGLRHGSSLAGKHMADRKKYLNGK